ncbi:hypothetical protein GCM10017635_15340 [Paracoccus kondratievae]|uniref:Uncharacterized protein n=2 Tax=Paracoccus kondratievae TaxID=135740 RepID=A0AAD3RT31_9RHOB|nr:hypothetical protein GCM10017635_15340 [Paracoccus kondratievae]
MQHVAAHRPGRPGKIASDSELRAFVEARLSHMTFAEIEAAVTAQVAPFVQVPGLEGAIRFILAFGDAELYIGKNPRDTNELVQMFGRESAEAFANLATLSRRIPPAKPWLAAHSHAQGLSIARIAQKLRISDISAHLSAPRGREPRTTARRRRRSRLPARNPLQSVIPS